MHHNFSVLFVCLGNICRSPLAEGAFRNAAKKAGLDVFADSAGTAAYHIGEPPDPRSIATAARRGIDISQLRGRQVTSADFTRFSHIFALDTANLRGLLSIKPGGSSARLAMLMDAVPGRQGMEVSDPYYGGEEGFEQTWQDVECAASALVAQFKNAG